MKYLFVFLLLTFVWSGCTDNEPVVPVPDEDIQLGGETSINNVFIKIFEQPAPNLSAVEKDLHFKADAAFGAIYVTAPSTIQSGLGPLFNQNSCESCHLGNGRSAFPNLGNDLKGLLFRVSIPGKDGFGGNLPVPHFGLQLQTKASFGKQAEVQMTIQEVEEIQQFIDGSTVNLRKPIYKIESSYLPIDPSIEISPRIASPIIGLGLLEAIKESDILKLSDEMDVDQDGISGKANYVWDIRKKEKTIGRFGWKASQPNLYQQTAAAFSGDMGITSPAFPVENSFGQIQFDSLFDDHEIDETVLTTTTFYTQSLGVPSRRNWNMEQVKQGKKLFYEIKCTACHHPQFFTGTHEFQFLSNQMIFPYTDMLLHDMGEGLADFRPDFEASGREWRTPPLWGIGLTQIVGGHTHFLHDGRARNLLEAIMWHGGEAEKSKNQFKALSKTERDAVVEFLKSL